MTTHTHQPNTPRLRFPEFAGEWEERRLGTNTIKVGSGVTPKGGATVYQKAGIPLIRSQNVRDGYLDLSDVAYISEEIHSSMEGSKVASNDVLLNITGASIGRSCVVPDSIGEANVNQHVCIIRLDGNIEPYFLHAFIASDRGNKLICQAQAGGGREGINFANIKSFKLNFPDLAEQQKIAAFLAAVDDRVEGLRRKRALLERYKKGMMQRIFSGEIRFTQDNGTPFPAWQEKKAKDVFANVSNKNHTGNLPILAVTQDAGVTLRSNLEKEIKSTDKSILSYKIIEPNDFIISLRSFQGGIEYSNVLGICSPAYTVLKPKIPLCHSLYKYYFKKEDFISKLSATVVGIIEGKQISYEAFSTLVIPYPSLAEQKKIADFFAGLDKKIDAVAAELAACERFKKGLLQQMFV